MYLDLSKEFPHERVFVFEAIETDDASESLVRWFVPVVRIEVEEQTALGKPVTQRELMDYTSLM